MCVHVSQCLSVCTYARISGHTETYTHARTHTETYTHARTHTETYTHARTHARTHTHRPTHMYAHTHRPTQMHAHTHIPLHCQVQHPKKWVGHYLGWDYSIAGAGRGHLYAGNFVHNHSRTQSNVVENLAVKRNPFMMI